MLPQQQPAAKVAAGNRDCVNMDAAVGLEILHRGGAGS